MKFRGSLSFSPLLFLLLTNSCSTVNDSLTLSETGTVVIQQKELPAGRFTIRDDSRQAFSHAVPGLDFNQKKDFFSGESFFDQNWVVAPASTEARDGLGPHFNARSCAACHVRDGRGKPPEAGETPVSLLFRLSIPGKNQFGGPLPEPVYGGQLQTFSIPGVKTEAEVKSEYLEVTGEFADGEKYVLLKPVFEFINPGYGSFRPDMMFSPRVAPVMTGLGLLENIPERDILDQADPDDKNKDGISGRPNYVWDYEKKAKVLGRFGWKANQPSLRQQVAGAFSGDLGITTGLFPETNFTESQEKKYPEVLNGGNPEIEDRLFEKVVFYSQKLAVPARRNINHPDVIAGEKIFTALNCNSCHRIEYKLNGETITPFTDLLLHDMGEELADNRPDFEADGREWRTPPLWGIGLVKTVNEHTRFLHDGRARNLSEAILWHGGEAELSVNGFKQLSKNERNSLIKYLESL